MNLNWLLAALSLGGYAWYSWVDPDREQALVFLFLTFAFVILAHLRRIEKKQSEHHRLVRTMLGERGRIY